MIEAQSIVVGLDGESKCGKTFVAACIAERAERYAISRRAAATKNGWSVSRHSFSGPTEAGFARFKTISAGNMFRAAAHLIIEGKTVGRQVQAYDDQFAGRVRALLAQDGAIEHLQCDQQVKEQVNKIAQIDPVFWICKRVFCEAVRDAYVAQPGANLVVTDARNPVATLRRGGALGAAAGMIAPRSIIPVFIDTPVEVAAAREPGDYARNLELITTRRHDDATRSLHPVHRPDDLVPTWQHWTRQFSRSAAPETVVSPFLFDNGAEASVDMVRTFAGHIAQLAADMSMSLGRAPRVPSRPVS